MPQSHSSQHLKPCPGAGSVFFEHRWRGLVARGWDAGSRTFAPVWTNKGPDSETVHWSLQLSALSPTPYP